MKIRLTKEQFDYVMENYFSPHGIKNVVYEKVEEKIKIQSVEIEKIAFALGVFNSMVVDFVVRSMVQIHLNKTYISRIPFPQPTAEEIRNSPLYTTIARNALALQLYNDKKGHFQVLSSLFGSEDWVQIGEYQGCYGLGGEILSHPQSHQRHSYRQTLWDRQRRVLHYPLYIQSPLHQTTSLY